MAKVQTVSLLFESLVFAPGGPDLQSDPLRLHCLLATIFAWCLTWGLGGNLEEQCNDKFDSFVKDLLSECPDVKVNDCLFFSFFFFFMLLLFFFFMYSETSNTGPS
jgi:hypothetical protein